MRLLPKYIENGVDCIKVEGRMKSALYAATTTSAYSQALKWCSSNLEKKWNGKLIELSAILEKIPHRGTPKLHLKNRLDWIVFIVEIGMEAFQDMRLQE